MTLPPFLMTSALLFWGWQTGMMVFAMGMALVLELPRWTATRWEVEDGDFKRIRDLCSVLIVGALVYAMVTRDATNEIMEFFQAANFTARGRSMQEVMNSMYVFVQWWPLLFLPVMAAQAWNTTAGTPFHIYSYILSRKQKKGAPVARGRVDVSWPYFLVVLVSASSANNRSGAFYPVLCLIVAWALWCRQPRRFPAWVWGILLAAVVAGGQWGHTSIRGLQSYLDGAITQWISDLARRDSGRLSARTAMGQIGRMKLSGRIVMRMQAEGAAPSLLREASYDQLLNTTWRASAPAYFDLFPEGDDFDTWPIMPPGTNSDRVTISMSVPKTEGWLALPAGTTTLSKLPVNDVQTNAFGFVWVRQTPGFLHFTAEHAPGPTRDRPPTFGKLNDGSNDLEVPEAERAVIAGLAGELNLRRGTLHERTEKIMDYFSRNFTYTTWLKAREHLPRRGETALGRFLTIARSGHCEYFASATVLLLREAGIPARYASGYSVQEKKGDGYVIRERHAHAWAIYWDDMQKAWKDLDTTPGGWAEVDAEEGASIFEPLRDAWSNLWHSFSLWRHTGEKGAVRKYVLMTVALLLVVLVWRLLRQGRSKRTVGVIKTGAVPEVVRQGIDSAFFRIEDVLEREGLERRPGEPLSIWLRRIEPLTMLPVAQLRPLLALHYRYRFDPVGLTEDELRSLSTGATAWIQSIASARPDDGGGTKPSVAIDAARL